MSDLTDKCEEYFGTRDFYEVLNVKNTASLKEIKRAYYKLSLLVHPDRVDDNKKTIATEKFKILGKIHSILQDEDKRKIYDERGSYDEDEDFSSTNWMNYWRAMFKKISTQDIENYKKEYIGSDIEKNDIKKAYVGGKGNMDRILEMVPFSNCDSESRIIEIVTDMVDNGEVERYACFFNEPQKKKMRRKGKWEQEKKDAEKLNVSDDDLATKIQQQQEQRMKSMEDLFSKYETKYGDKGTKRKSIKFEEEEEVVQKKSRRTRSKK